jgi:GMP synthase-like glutamine amidotransferase
MRALFIQHDHVSPPGPVGEGFARRGYDVEKFLVVPAGRFHTPGVTATFPDPSDYDAIVPMGAPWSVYDEAAIGSWIGHELAFLRAAHHGGVPVLGICFGGQALAAALGGCVEAAPEAEIGWYALESNDPELLEPGPWFQWHADRWTPPAGARAVAHTRAAQQAFVLGRSLAVQFHPELTPPMLQGWLGNGGEAYLSDRGLPAGPLLARTRAEGPAAAARAGRLVDRFLDQVALAPVV